MAKRRTYQEDETDGLGPRDHERTWGMTEAGKAQWTDRNADQVREAVDKRNAEKEDGDA